MESGKRVAGVHGERALMLPVTFQFLIATVAHALNERMARKVEYRRGGRA